MHTLRRVDAPLTFYAQIFAGVSVYLNGSTADSANLELIRLVQAGGGRVQYGGCVGCTHVVAESNLSAKKENDELKRRKQKARIVKPAWILESVAAGRRLPESQFGVIAAEVRRGALLRSSKALMSAQTQPAINGVFVGTIAPQPSKRTSPRQKAKHAAVDLAWLESEPAVKPPTAAALRLAALSTEIQSGQSLRPVVSP